MDTALQQSSIGPRHPVNQEHMFITALLIASPFNPYQCLYGWVGCSRSNGCARHRHVDITADVVATPVQRRRFETRQRRLRSNCKSETLAQIRDLEPTCCGELKVGVIFPKLTELFSKWCDCWGDDDEVCSCKGVCGETGWMIWPLLLLLLFAVFGLMLRVEFWAGELLPLPAIEAKNREWLIIGAEIKDFLWIHRPAHHNSYLMVVRSNYKFQSARKKKSLVNESKMNTRELSTTVNDDNHHFSPIGFYGFQSRTFLKFHSLSDPSSCVYSTGLMPFDRWLRTIGVEWAKSSVLNCGCGGSRNVELKFFPIASDFDFFSLSLRLSLRRTGNDKRREHENPFREAKKAWSRLDLTDGSWVESSSWARFQFEHDMSLIY